MRLTLDARSRASAPHSLSFSSWVQLKIGDLFSKGNKGAHLDSDKVPHLAVFR